jgi:hypothetical protein
MIFFQINMTLGEGAVGGGGVGRGGDERNFLAALAMIYTKLNKNLQKNKIGFRFLARLMFLT